MSWGKSDICNVNKRIQEIKCSNDILNYGLSELESVYVRIQSDMVPDNEMAETKKNAHILNAKNHCLARTINKALKEVESNLRQQLDSGIYIDQNVIHEFSVVLRESIRILHDYRLVQEAYQEYVEQTSRSSISHQFEIADQRKDKYRQKAPMQRFQRIIKILCACGSG